MGRARHPAHAIACGMRNAAFFALLLLVGTVAHAQTADELRRQLDAQRSRLEKTRDQGHPLPRASANPSQKQGVDLTKLRAALGRVAGKLKIDRGVVTFTAFWDGKPWSIETGQPEQLMYGIPHRDGLASCQLFCQRSPCSVTVTDPRTPGWASYKSWVDVRLADASTLENDCDLISEAVKQGLSIEGGDPARQPADLGSMIRLTQDTGSSAPQPSRTAPVVAPAAPPPPSNGCPAGQVPSCWGCVPPDMDIKICPAR